MRLTASMTVQKPHSLLPGNMVKIIAKKKKKKKKKNQFSHWKCS